MRFFVRALTQADFAEITGWRYPAPYDSYDITDDIRRETLLRGLYGADGALCGAFDWGKEGQVEPAAALYAERPEPLDFGIGLRPDLTGRGIGVFAVEAALTWLRQEFQPETFRLAVRRWNVRARSVYRRIGFSVVARYDEYDIMERDERPWRDASRPLVPEMEIYPGDPGFERNLFKTAEDCGWNLSVVTMSVHCGTHIDAPKHIGRAGDTASVDIAALNGIAQLIDLRESDASRARCPRMIVKTGGRGLTMDEARTLLDAGVTMIGVDGLSVGGEGVVREVHELLIDAGVVLLENAAVEGFAPGWYEMRCLPMLLSGSDGAPARLQLRALRG